MMPRSSGTLHRGSLHDGGVQLGRVTRLSALLALLLLPQFAAAQSPPPVRGEPVVRRLFVPANQPEQWPTGPWEPWSAQRVEEGLRAVRRVRSWGATPALADARYQATLLGDSLAEGRLWWTVEDRDGEPRFVELEPCQLVLQRLAWEDAESQTSARSITPLAWGRTVGGRLGFICPGSTGPEIPGRTVGRPRLEGDWALDGERFGPALVFALVLPPAQVTRLELRVPQGLRLTTSVGDCRVSTAGAPAGWNLWRIELGQHHECRLRVAPDPGERDSAPRLTARPDISFTVRPEATRVRAMFEFAAWEGEVDSVEVAVPEELQIANVLYGDLPTAWNGVPGQPGRLIIPLPEKVRGSLRRIELRGLLPGSLNQTWRMPPLGTPGALELEGHLGVRLQGVLPVSSLRHTGLRQFGYDPSPQDGEVFEFRRLRPDATLELSPVQGPLRMAFQSLSILDTGSPWQAECHLLWTLGEGSSWSVACQLPAEWEVLDVRRQEQSGSDETRTIDWTLVPQGAWQHVVAELSEQLDSEHPVRLQMTVRGPATGRGGSLPLPLVKPVEGRAAEQITLLPGGLPDRLEASEGYRRTEVPREGLVAALPEIWKSPPLLAELSRKLDLSPFVEMVVSSGEAQGRLRLPSPPESSPAEELGTPVEPGPNLSRVAGTANLPAWISRAATRVRLSAGGDQVDDYEVTWLVPARDDTWPLRWSFPQRAESPRVVVDGVIGTPLDQSGSFRQGVLLPARKAGETMQRVALRYRHDDGVRHGLRQRRLELPVPNLPVIQTCLDLRLPATLLLATPPAGFLPTGDPTAPEANSWFRNAAESRFNPWVADHWWQLIQGTRGGPTAEPIAEWSWQGEAAGSPDHVELATWNRTEARGLGWWACLASLALGLSVRQHRPNRDTAAIPLLLALLGIAALWSPPLLWPLLQSAALGCLISLLIPATWMTWRGWGQTRPPHLASRRDPAPAAGLSRTLGAGFGLCLWLASGARSQTDGPPRALLGPLESLGDILIPLDVGGVAEDRLYVSPEFRGNVAEPLRQVTLPRWLAQETTLQSLPDQRPGDPLLKGDQPSRDLLEARHRGVRVGTEPVEIPLQLAGLTLADDVSCLVNGRPHDVWRTDANGGLVVSLAAHEHLGPPVGREPRPPSVPLPDETPAARADLPAAPLDVLTELEIVLRLLPLPDETLRRARRVTLPAAAVTRLRLPGDTRLGHWTLVQPAATYHPPPRVGLPEEWGVEASELQWQTAPGETPVRQEAIRVESWNLVEFDGQVTTTRCWARYLPGGTQVQSVRWTIPRGMTVRQIEGPPLSGETWQRLEGGDRRLCLEFAEPQTQSFEVILDLISAFEGNPLELRFPDPADNTLLGRLRFDLRQDRVALRSPSDRQLMVSSPMIDQPLRVLAPADLARESRFGEVTPDLGFELDRPLSLMVLMQTAAPPLQAATIEQRGEIRRGQLDWNYRAADVRSKKSVFHYELAVDPRIEIREVHVREQETDRVARWSRDGDRLTVFLASRAGTSQTVDISGSLPLPETGEIAPPLVSLRGLRPTIERRLLTVVDEVVSARLTQGDAPGRAPGGSLLLFDAPSNPEEEWPTLRLTGPAPRAPDRPDAPENPADEAGPGESSAAPDTLPLVVRHAELELAAPTTPPWTCLVRLWLSPGESHRLSWSAPSGAEVRAVQWNGVPLECRAENSPHGPQWTCVVPARTDEGLLQAVWQLPQPPPHSPPPLWPQPLPELPRVTDAELERLTLIWNSDAWNWLSIAPPWREITGTELGELRGRLTLPPTARGESERIAVGSPRAMEEWRNGGVISGLTVWPGHRIRWGGLGVATLTLALLVWWLTPLWKLLQNRGSLTLALAGLMWWGWLPGGGWGFLLAAISVPWAFWDLRPTFRRPAWTRG